MESAGQDGLSTPTRGTCINLAWPSLWRIAIVGLENAGKSTLLRVFSRDLDIPVVPADATSPRPDAEALSEGISTIVAVDVGGGRVPDPKLWTEDISDIRAIIFMVDAHDAERLDEAAKELHALSAAEGLEGVPIVVLGNKIDRPGAITLSQVVSDRLRLEGIQERHINVFMCSLMENQGMEGVDAGIRWLKSMLNG